MCPLYNRPTKNSRDSTYFFAVLTVFSTQTFLAWVAEGETFILYFCLSMTEQYCHFWKHKLNILYLVFINCWICVRYTKLIYRIKKYKLNICMQLKRTQVNIKSGKNSNQIIKIISNNKILYRTIAFQNIGAD